MARCWLQNTDYNHQCRDFWSFHGDWRLEPWELGRGEDLIWLKPSAPVKSSEISTQDSIQQSRHHPYKGFTTVHPYTGPDGPQHLWWQFWLTICWCPLGRGPGWSPGTWREDPSPAETSPFTNTRAIIEHRSFNFLLPALLSKCTCVHTLCTVHRVKDLIYSEANPTVMRKTLTVCEWRSQINSIPR